MNKFWFMNRFLYFFINMHAQIEKLIAKIKSIIWNTWMEISLTASFGVKCGVEVCSKLLNSNVAYEIFIFELPQISHACLVFLLCLDCKISVIWASVWLFFYFCISTCLALVKTKKIISLFKTWCFEFIVCRWVSAFP